MQPLNSNIASLTAQCVTARSQDELLTSLQRLSTGLRVNGAKDDAAGLAISTRFEASVRGLNRAAKNVNDAISLLQNGRRRRRYDSRQLPASPGIGGAGRQLPELAHRLQYAGAAIISQANSEPRRALALLR